jgi:hypothetical protein
LVVADFTFPSGVTISSVTDNKSGNWNKAVEVAGNDIVKAQYYLTNAATDTKTITLALSISTNKVSARFSEVFNVAKVSPVDSTSTNETTTSPAIATAALTTATDGCIIFHSSIDTAGGTIGLASAFTNVYSRGFIPLSLDRNMAALDLYYVQPNRGTILPAVNITQTAGDPYLSYAVAYKPAVQGTPAPAGMRIYRLYETFLAAGASQSFPMPSSGNLMVISTSYPNDVNPINAITNEVANTITKVSTSVAHSPQMFYATNHTGGQYPARRFTVNCSGSIDGFMLFCYDTMGASLAAPFDSRVESTSTQGAANEIITNAPTITPSAASSLGIMVTGYGTGPSYGITTTNDYSFFDGVTYAGQTDASPFTAGDGYGHIFNLTTDLVNWGWHMTNGVSSGWNALGAFFKQ